MTQAGAGARTRARRGRLPVIAAALLSCQGAWAYEPQTNYQLQCMGCHTPDGSGEPGRVPSIKETLAPFALSPEGRRFLIQVPGASQSTLSDAELAELLNWMVQNLSLVRPGGFTRFTEAEVAGLRRTPLVDVQGTRRRLVESLKSELAR
jgi:mono/diheme cytochrome c family protein